MALQSIEKGAWKKYFIFYFILKSIYRFILISQCQVKVKRNLFFAHHVFQPTSFAPSVTFTDVKVKFPVLPKMNEACDYFRFFSLNSVQSTQLANDRACLVQHGGWGDSVAQCKLQPD